MYAPEIKDNLFIAKKIIEKYPREQRYSLAVLQDIQREYSYIPRECLKMISEHLRVPVSKLYSMATFYKALSLVPKGENVITVCDGTACHVRSSMVLIDEIEKCLNIRPGQTTEDGKFSLQTVNCLGSCAIAPVMMVNDKYYGKVTPNTLREILKNYGGVENE
ncbi:NADH-quinone oxidoreductase subunit NuoE [Fonticella tunisiensis]|uniref:NADH-quinone oxidoreductase subunit E n=1 Tax=Fonticella tunisiensis TaxID=1096341 RepID=A0A4R7K9Y6_9CLOT|nr:NADH-quinone oxidoreductase subunit NuoE [Fonticella tunisiensis]TDT51058.1 NADH-quinone oxidoreductase subunit E [Fonticella tunisiensis]